MDNLDPKDAEEIANAADYLLRGNYQHPRIHWRFVAEWTIIWIEFFLLAIGILFLTDWLRQIGG